MVLQVPVVVVVVNTVLNEVAVEGRVQYLMFNYLDTGDAINQSFNPSKGLENKK